MLKLVNSGTAEGQHYPELFDLLLEALLKLKKGQNAKRAAKGFEKDFVELEGIHREGVDPQYALSEHVGRDLRKW
jgi:recombinational DNA repair protein (RecF pathway)